MEISNKDVKIEKCKLLPKHTNIKATPYFVEKTKLTPSLQPQQTSKQNACELLDYWQLFCLFCRLGARFEWLKINQKRTRIFINMFEWCCNWIITSADHRIEQCHYLLWGWQYWLSFFFASYVAYFFSSYNIDML